MNASYPNLVVPFGDKPSPAMVWEPGCRVLIQGLQGAMELNGQEGVVLQQLPENLSKGRVRVQVAGRELAVRPQALVVLPDVQEDPDMEEEEESEDEDEFEDDDSCDDES